MVDKDGLDTEELCDLACVLTACASEACEAAKERVSGAYAEQLGYTSLTYASTLHTLVLR